VSKKKSKEQKDTGFGLKNTTVQYVRMSSINKDIRSRKSEVCASAKLQKICVPPRASYSRATHDSSPEVKQPGRIQLITQSTSFRNRERVELYLHSPICLHGVHRDKRTARSNPIYNYTIIDAYENVFHLSALLFLLKT